jgi:hypothetical protein
VLADTEAQIKQFASELRQLEAKFGDAAIVYYSRLGVRRAEAAGEAIREERKRSPMKSKSIGPPARKIVRPN